MDLGGHWRPERAGDVSFGEPHFFALGSAENWRHTCASTLSCEWLSFSSPGASSALVAAVWEAFSMQWRRTFGSEAVYRPYVRGLEFNEQPGGEQALACRVPKATVAFSDLWQAQDQERSGASTGEPRPELVFASSGSHLSPSHATFLALPREAGVWSSRLVAVCADVCAESCATKSAAGRSLIRKSAIAHGGAWH